MEIFNLHVFYMIFLSCFGGIARLAHLGFQIYLYFDNSYPFQVFMHYLCTTTLI